MDLVVIAQIITGMATLTFATVLVFQLRKQNEQLSLQHRDAERNLIVSIREIASSRGRKTNKNIKLGICGEHGGDPKSIEFCSRTGLNYVSCSPFRVPVARLAAAQAELSK